MNYNDDYDGDYKPNHARKKKKAAHSSNKREGCNDASSGVYPPMTSLAADTATAIAAATGVQEERLQFSGYGTRIVVSVGNSSNDGRIEYNT
eukprot:scaffold35021_cov160-Amphora_coffeaeformis.AAC.2